MKEKIAELLISGLCFLAVELGGFDIQVGPGEISEPPSGWEQDSMEGSGSFADEENGGGISEDQISEPFWNDFQNGAEQDETQEQNPGETESFGDSWNASEENRAFGYEGPGLSEGSSPNGNPGEGSAESSGSVSDQYGGTEKANENNRNNGGENGHIQEKSNPEAGTSEKQIQKEAKKEDIPEASVSPAAADMPEPSSGPASVTPAPVLSGPAGNGDSQESGNEGNTFGENMAAPDILYLTGNMETTARLRLRLNTKGEVQVLSFRVNGKEQGWHWQGDTFTADADTEKGSLVELALFTDCSWTLPENRVILSCNTGIS